MVVTDEIRGSSIQRASADEIAEVAVRDGMRRLREDGLEKVRQGRTSIAEVARVVGTGSPASESGPRGAQARRLAHRYRGHHGLRLRRPPDGRRLAQRVRPAPRRRARRRASASAAAWSPRGLSRLTPTDTREIVYSILTNDQRQRLETDWQLDFAYAIPGHARFRVNAYFQRGALGAAFRLIPAARSSRSTSSGCRTAVHEFTHKPRGFVLVTGPTGSGKSTSLAAMIDAINRRARSTS